ncbi:MAG: hypothetical protein DRP64_02335, partial [Verrucomicrobia bacterium]
MKYKSTFILFLMLAGWSHAKTYPNPLGINLTAPGGWGLEFVDAAKYATEWTRPDGTKANLDANGWPQEDAQVVLFDLRFFGAWWGAPYDDPDERQADVGGLYKLKFTGEAKIVFPESGGLFVLSNQQHDPETDITTADLYLKGPHDPNDPENPNKVGSGEHSGLLVLQFLNTGGGIKNLTLIRPGYHGRTEQTFTDEFIKLIKPFSVLRFMDWIKTNNSSPFHGDPWPANTTRWDVNRNKITDATQRSWGNRPNYTAWEYIIELSNLVQKDLWICIPVSADDDYVKKLAILMRTGVDMGSTDVSGDYDLADGTPTCNPLDSSLKIYLEHSNEVWNFGFKQYIYNKLAAIAEAKQPDHILSKDGLKDEEMLARRRHLKRTIETGQIFSEVFADQMKGKPLFAKIRPIYTHRIAKINTEWEAQLRWGSKQWKPLKKYLYALGGAPYFDLNGALKADESVDDILEHAEDDIENTDKKEGLIDLADDYQLKAICYEGGPDSGGGKTVNIQNRIRANRDPRIRALIQKDIEDHWFKLGGDLFMYFE